MSWRRTAYRAVRPLLFAADAERIHSLAVALLASPVGRAMASFAAGTRQPHQAAELLGLRFRNPVGLAAGFDKDGVAIRGWAALGFGFVELGTVTPRPQGGNPRPRLFRLPHDEALINRMGFNNAGAPALAARIAEARPHLPPGFVVGVNIGRGRDGDVDDYATAARAVADVADYLAINVSSPNTPGLRDLQDPDTVRGLARDVRLAAPGRPLLVKLAPDLADDQLDALLDAVAEVADGVILSNTTLTRPRLRTRRLAQEAGGLSGRPLLPRTLRSVGRAADRDLRIVASGGIASAVDAAALRAAGADLVQLWTGMIYAGPGLVGEVVAAC